MPNTTFSILEILKLAISMEDEGVKFYTKYANMATGETKDVLLRLADDEKNHAKVFTNMYDECDKSDSVDEYLFFTQDVNTFFSNFTKNIGFKREQEELSTVEDAIRVGVDTEQITIDYYKGLSEYADDKTKEILDRLIDEETKHLNTLKELV